MNPDLIADYIRARIEADGDVHPPDAAWAFIDMATHSDFALLEALYRYRDFKQMLRDRRPI